MNAKARAVISGLLHAMRDGRVTVAADFIDEWVTQMVLADTVLKQLVEAEQHERSRT